MSNTSHSSPKPVYTVSQLSNVFVETKDEYGCLSSRSGTCRDLKQSRINLLQFIMPSYGSVGTHWQHAAFSDGPVFILIHLEQTIRHHDSISDELPSCTWVPAKHWMEHCVSAAPRAPRTPQRGTALPPQFPWTKQVMLMLLRSCWQGQQGYNLSPPIPDEPADEWHITANAPTVVLSGKWDEDEALCAAEPCFSSNVGGLQRRAEIFLYQSITSLVEFHFMEKKWSLLCTLRWWWYSSGCARGEKVALWHTPSLPGKFLALKQKDATVSVRQSFKPQWMMC